jgi:hypothetical protein
MALPPVQAPAVGVEASFIQMRPVRLSVMDPSPLSANLGEGQAAPVRNSPSYPDPAQSIKLPLESQHELWPVFGNLTAAAGTEACVAMIAAITIKNRRVDLNKVLLACVVTFPPLSAVMSLER